MRKFILLYLFILSQLVNAQNYNFSGTMSKDVLENYLERSITMQGQSDIEGPSLLSETERLRNIAMINDIGAKFVGRIAGWWDSGYGQTNLNNIFAKCQLNVQNIKANDQQVICQAAVFEYVSDNVLSFNIPPYVFQAFGLAVQNRTFNYAAMLYPAPASQYRIYNTTMSEDDRKKTPDITQLETQLWFYYLATNYIDAGCEAIHFGQVGLMNRRDVGNKIWWSFLQKIRLYATTKNRGLVLCDAHVSDGGFYYEPNMTMTLNDWQYYKPINDWQKQLILDFHSAPVRYIKNTSQACTSTTQPIALVRPYYSEDGLYGHSLGGMNPQGWLCRSNPYLVELDNYDVMSIVGCNNTINDYHVWGWDEISWFALQQEAYRNEVLKYTYYKVKCMDANGHLEMPGMRGTKPYLNGPNIIYRANTGNYNQQSTIKNIWNGNFSYGNNWVIHNFSDEQIMNPPNIVKDNIVFVGNNKIYYIGTDNRVHAYIKYGNMWLTTSPSYASPTPINNQVQAAGDLVVNPSGTYLYYRGIDGLIYQYQIINEWTYAYSAMPTNTSMIQQNIRAAGSLICASDNRLYYIAKELNNGNAQRVHAFIKSGNTWSTTSPSWVAHSNGSPISTQIQAYKSLAINPSKTTLYYIGSDGFIYQYQILSDWLYTYSTMPTNTAMSQQNIRAESSLTCATDNRIYYIANELGGNAKRIHAFIRSGNIWNTTSPSWVAHSNGSPVSSQAQPASSSLSVSPNNSYIAFVGTDNQLHGFNIINDWLYQYFNFKIVPFYEYPKPYTVFNNENKLFYIPYTTTPALETNKDKKMFYFSFEQDYCSNSSVQIVDPGCCNYTRKANDTIKQEEKEDMQPKLENNINIFPVPTHDLLNIEADNFFIKEIKITSIDGKEFFKQQYKNESIVTINVNNYPSGIYFISLTDNTSTLTKKIIIH